jgi:oligopeptide/dipeptide ABC transporter ATP-binding protein
VLLITHDLAVVSSLCDRVVVLYGGEVMEAGPIVNVFTRPRHPYTRFLLGSASLEISDDSQKIREAPVDFTLAGCRFARRCALATDICLREPPAPSHRDESAAYCHHLEATRALAC